MDHSDAAGTLFGTIPLDRLLDDEDRDSVNGEERESDFETESLASSSSDGMADRSASSPEHHVCRRRHASATEESDADGISEEVPNWFVAGPFKYNGRIAALALPGLVLALLFAGEMLLGLVTIGMLIVYLLYSSGSRQRALVAYLLLFIGIQLTVVYSILPLVWKSILNLFIVLALNIYTFLTGGWILLLFENFRFREIDLLMLIETSLFSLYPMAFVIQVTWLVAATTSVAVAPYVFMFAGFIVFQVFLAPLQSSFVKPHAQGDLAVWDSEGYVLSPVVTGTIAMMYALAGPSLVFILRAAAGWRTLFNFATVVQMVFIASSSIFLATFLHLRLFLESTGTPPKAIQTLRWCAALLSLVLIAPLLDCYDVRSNLLPWIPVVVTILIGLILSTLRKNKIGSYVSLASLCVVSVVVFYQLPWRLDYNLASGLVSLTFVESLLLLNSVVCVGSIYVAIYRSPDELAACLLLQSLLCVITSKLLLADRHLSLILLLLLTIVYFYLALRLHHSGRLARRPSLIISALHLSSLATGAGHVYGTLASSSGVLMNIYDFVSTLALSIVLLRALVFEEADIIETRRLLEFSVALFCTLLANVPVLLTDLIAFLTAASPTFSSYVGFVGLVESVVYLKLVCFNGCAPVHDRLSLFAVVAVPCAGLLALGPEMSLERSELQKWAMIVGIGCVTAVAPVASAWRGSLHVVGAALGLPAGLCLLHALFPSSPSLPVQVAFGLLMMLCLTLLLVAWYQPRSTDQWIRNIGVSIVACCAALHVLSVPWLTAVDTDSDANAQPTVVEPWPTPVAMTTFVSLILVAAVVRLRISSLQLATLEPHPNKPFDLTPVLGNMCTLASYLIFCANHPPIVVTCWYLWSCVGTPILLLLNNDSLLLSRLHISNRVAPPTLAAVLTLYGAVLYDTAAFDANRSTLDRVFGAFELVSIIAGIPVAIVTLTMTFAEKSYGGDLAVVFTTPTFPILFLTGTTYASWFLAACGLAAGYWLMKYKLQFSGTAANTR